MGTPATRSTSPAQTPPARRRGGRTGTLLLAGALLLGACAGADESGEPDEPAAAPTTQAPSEPAAAAMDANVTQGCVEQYAEGTDVFPDKASFEHATGVSVTYEDTYKVVEVQVPYAAEGTPPFTVVLHQCGTPEPALEGDLAQAQVIQVPVEDVITMTTVNLPHLTELDAVGSLVGVGTAAFVTTPEIVAALEAGDIEEFADATGAADRERILAASPDLLIVDAFGETLLDDIRGFATAGVPAVINADFNEPSPIARAEWVKFTALFLNKEAQAEQLFASISDSYDETAGLVADVAERPTVLLDQPFEGTWYAPAGGSFPAQLIADAGGDYVFASDEGSGSLSLDIETVLDRGGDAQVWIGAGSVNGTLDDLLAVDQRFAEFAAFQAGEVYAADAATNEAGGNAIFERGVLRPDLVLADLVAILHPDRLPGHQMEFYGPVPEAG